jgi:AraC-like DNA-binding protein
MSEHLPASASETSPQEPRQLPHLRAYSTAQHGMTPSWYADLQSTHAIHAVVSRRVELPLFLIHWRVGQPLQWTDLTDPHYRLRPFHFEIHYGKRSVRDSHYVDCLTRARLQPTPVVAELFGFWDMFYRLPVGDGEFYLYSGQFSRESPTWEGLSNIWAQISERDATSADPDFVHFVRMSTALPVLEQPLLEGWCEFAMLYARLLVHDGSEQELSEARTRIAELNRRCFVQRWPATELVDDVVSGDKFQLPMWGYERQLSSWMQEELGIERLPTTAMAIMPLDGRTHGLDPVQAMVRNATLQRACIEFARELRETAATRLQDYGVTLVTSCRPEQNPVADRAELRERAERFRAFVLERFGVSSVVGIGPSLTPGAQLYESHREAVLALHMCTQLDKSVLFFDEHGERHHLRYSELHSAAHELEAALLRESPTEIKLESDRYVQTALRFANGRVEVLRGQFLATLFRLLEVVERRNPLHGEVHERFAQELTEQVEIAHSQQQLIASFALSLQRLSLVFSRQWSGPNAMRLATSLQFLRENLSQDLSLPAMARRAGLSVPVFSRAFREATGNAFLTYLRRLRVEHAKKLLATTIMTTEEIATSCGFSSPHHLIRSFKKVTTQTPGAYRRDNPYSLAAEGAAESA